MATVEKTLGIIPRPRVHTGFWSWITTVDHKRIGILYAVTALAFFILGGVEALLIRLQLMGPDLNVLSAETYNEVFTMHATTMIFLAVMPLSAAFFNYIMPLQIGARDVAFPRLNAFSYWLFLFGGIFINTSWFLGGAPNAGWFGYANLTSVRFSPGVNVDFWVLGLQLLGVATLVSGFNFIVTILNMRAPGMTLWRMPIFSWITLIVSFMIIFAFPPITVALIMLMLDRTFATTFFETAAGGNVVFWQHLFWTFGHPEVYILILPAMGIVSEVMPTFTRKPLFGFSVMVFSSALIGFMGFAVWSHHMFAVGMGPVVNSIFSLTTMLIGVPTGVKVFNWLATLWGGRIRLKTPMLFALAFIITFTVGGISGVMHASAPSDAQQTDTYFIVAHIHYVLVGGALLGLLAGAYYWFPKITGRMMDERLGKWNFWLVMLGTNLTFFPFHFIGLQGMPRRIYTYGPDLGVTEWNLLATIGVFILTAGILVFLANLVRSLRSGQQAGSDPWDARTLEWMTSSPPPPYNFAELPVVTARDHLWEQKQSGRKAARATAPRSRGDQGGIHMPGQSYMPALVALGLTVAAYGGIYKSVWLAVIGFAVAVLGLYGWVFEGDGGYIVEPEGEH